MLVGATQEFAHNGADPADGDSEKGSNPHMIHSPCETVPINELG